MYMCLRTDAGKVSGSVEKSTAANLELYEEGRRKK